MTYKTLKDNLNTHATAAGIKTFRFGYVEEINTLREKTKSVLYPVMLVMPPKWKVRTRTDGFNTELTFFIINDQTKAARATATREEAWDYMNTLAAAFVDAINNDSGLLVTSELTGTPYPSGITVNDDLGMEYTLTIKIIC
jgi:hypothetical protein